MERRPNIYFQVQLRKATKSDKKSSGLMFIPWNSTEDDQLNIANKIRTRQLRCDLANKVFSSVPEGTGRPYIPI